MRMRPFLRLSVFCAFLLGALAPLRETQADWPLFRGNPLQTGVATDPLPDKLVVRWQFKTGDSIESTAAIAGDTVYVGSMDGHLYALDLATGKEKWKFKAAPFRAPPSVRGDAVFVGDSDGVFHCVDAATGKERWTFMAGDEVSSGANFAGDRILFGSGDEHLYCLASDGKLVWKFQVPGGPVLGTPSVVEGRTFAAGCDSALHIIDTATGKEVAAVELDGQTGASAAVSGTHLFLGTMSNQMLGVDWKTNKIVWTFEAPTRKQAFFASAAVTDKLVVVGSRDKRVWALERKTGKDVWSFPTQGRVDGSPVIVGARVFAPSLDGHLYVLDLAKGEELAKFKLGNAISASPAVGKESLVIGTQDGTVFCLGAK